MTEPDRDDVLSDKAEAIEVKPGSRWGIANRLTWFVVAMIAVLCIAGGTALARSSATTGWPAAKAQLYEREQQALAQAQSHPRPKLPSAGLAPASQPPPQRHAGIVAMRQGPFQRTTFVVGNFWQGPVGTDWLLAYAGAAPSTPNGPPARGAVRLYSETAAMHLSLIGTFPAPEGTGPLTITAVSDDVLHARTDNGGSVSFDLRTHRYN